MALVLGIDALGAGLLTSTVGAPAAAEPADDGTIDILVLGDSYSDGNGATDDQGNATAATLPVADAGHPGQVSFLAGVPQQFAGLEPDATVAIQPAGNPATWINQSGQGGHTNVLSPPQHAGPDDVRRAAGHPRRLRRTHQARLRAGEPDCDGPAEGAPRAATEVTCGCG